MTISDYEAAVFSTAAYTEEKGALVALLQLLQSPWKRTHFFESTNGLGISIFNNAAQQKTVVAFRGTKKIQNIISDFEILLGWPITIEKEAQIFYKEHAINYYSDVILTGHSLGGALACLMSLEYDVPAIIFDAPGCHRTVENQKKRHREKHKELIRAILGQPNLINTCDKQLGTLLFANTSPTHEKIGNVIDSLETHTALAQLIISPNLATGSIVAKKAAGTTLSLTSTIYLHKMQHFLAYLDPNAETATNNLPLPYIKKWCNWLNHLSLQINIPNAIRNKEISYEPVEYINNPQTNFLSTQVSSASYQISNSINTTLSSSSLENSFFKTPAFAAKEVDIETPIPSSIRQAMRSRIAKSNETFDQDNWIISIINYSSSAMFGHAILIVEGRQEDGQFFIGKYDIHAKLHDEKTSSVLNPNPTGYVSQVCIDESTTPIYHPNQPEIMKKIKRYNNTRHSYPNISICNAQNMIQSIREDYQKTERAYNNQDDFIPYQFLGEYGLLRMFLPEEEGINCTDWCRKKLRDAGIENVGGKKSQPTKAAGGVGCVVS